MAGKSAHGLFRATGKRAKPHVVRDLVTGEYNRIDKPIEREPDDFYPTPPEPTRAFLFAEIERLRMFDLIWEAAAGDGAMVRELGAVGLKVFASDLIDRGCGAQIKSFYDFTPNDVWPYPEIIRMPRVALVTNPPFQECNLNPGWVRHAIKTLKVPYMALLLPLNWLGAANRSALWEDCRPSTIYVMRWRIDFTGDGSPPMLNAWYVWDSAIPKRDPVMRMLDKDMDARQSALL